MTGDELRALYTEAHNIIKAERRMREHVFRDKPSKRDAKVAEMDQLLAIVMKMKDELKEHIGVGYEQPRLLDAPRRADYS